MPEATPLTQVAEFHTTFNHPILNEPGIPAAGRCALRVALLAEEVQELQAAIDDNNLVEVADALCDIQYVLAGAILEFGLADKFKQLFDEVHRSNMSKACRSEEEAIATVKHYKETADCDAYYEQKGELYLVYRNGDNKTLKSINYSPAALKSLI